MTTLFPSQTIRRLFATHSSIPPRNARGVVRSSIQIRPSSACCRSSRASLLSKSSSPSSSSSLSPHTSTSSSQRAKAGVLTSLAYSAIYSTAATTLALCNSQNDGNNNNNDDEDFISKIRSKLESQSFPDLLSGNNNDTINSIATALGSQLSLAISSGIPTDLSYGFFAGYFSGLALKKIGKVASVTLGMSFLALQTLAYHGYIDVHHEKLQKQVEELLDRNHDGVVDGEDLKSVLHDVQKVAGFGLEDNLVASGGGFGMGFLGGLKSG
ncbi:hypothetical protein ACHAXR_008348 [Thalassiosira sp. AJA248-18]